MGKSFNGKTGEFVAKQKGMYQFSATFLMKTDYGGKVKVTLKRNDVSIGLETVRERLVMKTVGCLFCKKRNFYSYIGCVTGAFHAK